MKNIINILGSHRSGKLGRWIKGLALCLAGSILLSAGSLAAEEAIPLDKLIRYYSAKAAVEKEFGMSEDYLAIQGVHRFLLDKKAQLASILKTSGKALPFDVANRRALHCYINWSQDQSSATAVSHADKAMYLDFRTKHLYVKKTDGSFDEFTRKGAFFKNVPADHPLLLTGKSVYPVSEDSYLLYSKKKHLPDQTFMVQSAQAPHPEGWAMENALVKLNSQNLSSKSLLAFGMMR
ncbi:hypothetical protein [Desulfospira joergensenii]|uniref:hypothetical protein n=1 Tax=Desulfospira joergensenii TaxID=53329 RepID=UPI0003B5F146|nr:hypothetical protein [Desulfospira joergensenii]